MSGNEHDPVAPLGQATKATVYTMGDRNYFLGIVALINSLRITAGSRDITLVVLDLGLTESQRRILSNHCRVLEIDPALKMHPWYMVAYPMFDHAEGVIAIIDSDIIVTAPLDPLFDAAERGAICVAPDPDSDRYFDSWTQTFELGARMRPGQVYANAGFIVFSCTEHPELLQRWWECNRSLFEQWDESQPRDLSVKYADQDALNAILRSEVPEGDVHMLSNDAAAYSQDDLLRVHINDLSSLDCDLRGSRVSLLHSISTPKPWQPKAWRRVRKDAFIHFQRRLLCEDDVEVQVPNREIVWWLRRGSFGLLTFNLLSACDFVFRAYRSVRHRMGPSVRLQDDHVPHR